MGTFLSEALLERRMKESGIKYTKYGVCENCNEPLEPVWFTEEETVVDNYSHMIYHTGRTRRAVDYLVCPCCLKKFCVDDSFDGPWRSG